MGSFLMGCRLASGVGGWRLPLLPSEIVLVTLKRRPLGKPKVKKICSCGFILGYNLLETSNWDELDQLAREGWGSWGAVSGRSLHRTVLCRYLEVFQTPSSLHEP